MTKAIPGTITYCPYLDVNLHGLRDYTGDDGGVNALYSDLTEKFARYLRKRIKDKRQNIVVISGPTGSGKSTLGIRLIRLMNPDINLEECYIYGYTDFAKVLADGPQQGGRILLFDEGSVILNSLSGQSAEGNGIIVLLDILRSWGMTIIICLPKFTDLNARARAHLVDFRIECPDKTLVPGYSARGMYELYAPNYNKWSKKSNSIFYDCIGAGLFPRMDKKLAEEYEATKLQHQLHIVNNYIEFGKINPTRADIERREKQKAKAESE